VRGRNQRQPRPLPKALRRHPATATSPRAERTQEAAAVWKTAVAGRLPRPSSEAGLPAIAPPLAV